MRFFLRFLLEIWYKFPRSRGLKLGCIFKAINTNQSNTNFPDIGDWNSFEIICCFLSLKLALDTNFPDLGDWNIVFTALVYDSMSKWRSDTNFPDLGDWNYQNGFLPSGYCILAIRYKFPRSRGLKLIYVVKFSSSKSCT